MCNHAEDMEKIDELRTRVELWVCPKCGHEEVRFYDEELSTVYTII